ncbi:SMP-30/gluconolactonase/LRE family protein [Janthinobacterium sp. SUN137]|uniref:SMP-30/gluconolactonase/LRE family protein n=1 Tax=Janthinobacterium sp. SUN137 TaxID=3014789 RepID=UPI0027143E41|nr:SMP-30/gluconolactonase/LRE family protein [Janthinobacterium sp. SUN137]MDO8042309.1 SMP-30/gluconolactonase/LRE family protein [Janthinobacterium sp. SUN137]
MPHSRYALPSLRTAVLAAALANLSACASPPAHETLFLATILTPAHSFTKGIEGPAVDADGNIYAVNFARQQTIGKVSPGGMGEVYLTLPGTSIANGIRFGSRGQMYLADYMEHTIYLVDPATRALTIHAREPRMTQPNDIAITADDVLYASDPNWKENTGRVWRIAQDGAVTLALDTMGTANGIEVSPDGKILYVNESVQRNIWMYDIAADGSLSGKRLLIKFDDFGMDGMRVDVDGNLYVTRYGKGSVVKLSPQGRILREISVPGAKPSNITFGGPDGRTAYVTEVVQGRLLQFRVDRPGLEWQRAQQHKVNAANAAAAAAAPPPAATESVSAE